jgi:hypothetical protein
MCFNVFLYGKTHVSYILHTKKTPCLTHCLIQRRIAQCSFVHSKKKTVFKRTRRFIGENSTLENKNSPFQKNVYLKASFKKNPTTELVGSSYPV